MKSAVRQILFSNPLINPARIGVPLWLKASAANISSTGNLVDSWKNLSVGSNATETATNRPTFEPIGMNGLPCVRFNGGQGLTYSYSQSVMPDYHFFIVGKVLAGTTATYQRIIDFGLQGDVMGACLFARTPNSGLSSINSVGGDIGSPQVLPQAPFLIEFQDFNDGRCKFFYNGNLISEFTNQNPIGYNVASSIGGTIGGGASVNISHPIFMDISEVILGTIGQLQPVRERLCKQLIKEWSIST